MNPEEQFTQKELIDIKKLGIQIENRIYTAEECRIMANRINDNIMNESKKNIPTLINNFRNVLIILDKVEDCKG